MTESAQEIPLRTERPSRPFLLRVAVVLLPFYALGFAYSAAGTLVQLLSESGRARPYHLPSGVLAFDEGAPYAVAVFTIESLLCGLASYGLVMNRRWARSMLVAFWPVAFVAAFVVPWLTGSPIRREREMAPVLIVVLIVWWYLYRKRNVVRYFG